MITELRSKNVIHKELKCTKASFQFPWNYLIEIILKTIFIVSIHFGNRVIEYTNGHQHMKRKRLPLIYWMETKWQRLLFFHFSRADTCNRQISDVSYQKYNWKGSKESWQYPRISGWYLPRYLRTWIFRNRRMIENYSFYILFSDFPPALDQESSFLILMTFSNKN